MSAPSPHPGSDRPDPQAAPPGHLARLRQAWHQWLNAWSPPSRRSSAAERAINDHDLTALRAALKTGNPDQVVETSGVTLLHVAIEEFPSAAMVLLEHGANPLLTTQDGQTPLDWAATPEFAVMPPVRQALVAAMQHRRVEDERATLRAVLDDEPAPSMTPSALSPAPMTPGMAPARPTAVRPRRSRL